MRVGASSLETTPPFHVVICGCQSIFVVQPLPGVAECKRRSLVRPRLILRCVYLLHQSDSTPHCKGDDIRRSRPRSPWKCARADVGIEIRLFGLGLKSGWIVGPSRGALIYEKYVLYQILCWMENGKSEGGISPQFTKHHRQPKASNL